LHCHKQTGGKIQAWSFSGKAEIFLILLTGMLVPNCYFRRGTGLLLQIIPVLIQNQVSSDAAGFLLRFNIPAGLAIQSR